MLGFEFWCYVHICTKNDIFLWNELLWRKMCFEKLYIFEEDIYHEEMIYFGNYMYIFSLGG